MHWKKWTAIDWLISIEEREGEAQASRCDSKRLEQVETVADSTIKFGTLFNLIPPGR